MFIQELEPKIRAIVRSELEKLKRDKAFWKEIGLDKTIYDALLK